MKKLLFNFILFVTSINLFASKDLYKYISLGANHPLGASVPTEQLSLGLRIPTPSLRIIDGFDISISTVNHTNDSMYYKQMILPKIVFLKELPKSIFYTDKGYIGIGAGLQDNSYSTSNQKKGYKQQVIIKKSHIVRTVVASFVSGITINKNPQSITFIQCELNIPPMLLFDNKYQHSTTMAISFNIGM